MYCSSCGEDIPDSSVYCQHCGAEVSPTEDRDWGTDTDEWGSTAPDDRETDSWETTKPADRSAGSEPTTDVSTSSTDSGTIAALVHVLALFTWAIGPAVVLVASDSEFVRENSRNALNWQLSFAIYMLVSIVLVFVLIGVFTAMLVSLLDLVFCILAAVKAADGEAWEYPLTIDFV